MSSQQHETAIAEQVTKLLSHFATQDEPLAVRRSLAKDWVEDLAEFSVVQVDHACREWRRNQSLRPTIADIRHLSILAQKRDLERQAITDERNQGLDEDTLAMWAGAEYHGDMRSPAQRRQAAIEASEEKFTRGAAWRAGKLDEYDARHHPERLRERQRTLEEAQRAANFQPISHSVSTVLAELGVSSEAAQ